VNGSLGKAFWLVELVPGYGTVYVLKFDHSVISNLEDTASNMKGKYNKKFNSVKINLAIDTAINDLTDFAEGQTIPWGDGGTAIRARGFLSKNPGFSCIDHNIWDYRFNDTRIFVFRVSESIMVVYGLAIKTGRTFQSCDNCRPILRQTHLMTNAISNGFEEEMLSTASTRIIGTDIHTNLYFPYEEL
jgi:hypothetical protein